MTKKTVLELTKKELDDLHAALMSHYEVLEDEPNSTEYKRVGKLIDKIEALQ